MDEDFSEGLSGAPVTPGLKVALPLAQASARSDP